MTSINPPDLAPPFARYAHGVVVPPGRRLLRTAGQLGLAGDGTVPAGAAAQAAQCFANLGAILAAAGMGPGDVIHLSGYVTARADMAAYMAARDAFLVDVPETALPTSTLIIVSGFSLAEFLVEVELWAAAP